jgi:hypothetical protein
MGDMMARLALSVFLVVCLSGPGAAQQSTSANPSQEDLERSFFTSASYRSLLEGAINAFEAPSSKTECSTLNIEEATAHSRLKPLTFIKTETGHAISGGAWIAVPKIDRCGSPARRRVLMSVAAPGKISPIPLAPGDHQGSLTLEMDTLRIVMPGLMARADCRDPKQFYLLDVKNTAAQENGNWSETWSAEACGRKVITDIQYIKDATGTQIRATLPPNK